MRVEDPRVELAIDFKLALGESPVWDDRENVLWFVDITAPAVLRFNPADRSVATFPMPAAVGSIGLADDDRLVVALRSGVHLFDPRTGALDFLVHPEPDRPMNRLNDGKVGPDGYFWVGSMVADPPRRQPSGALYRVGMDGTAERMVEGVIVSNGLAWSPDGRRMYHADSRGPYVQVYDFDAATGRIGNGHRLITLSAEEGWPDGAAVDVEGAYWSAGVTAGCINQISAEGCILRRFRLPLAAPTMPCFGGRDGRTLFVTSLTSDRAGQHQEGTLIGFRVDVAGVPIGRFATSLVPAFSPVR
jgi:sugar lactone lactonase YvrE